MRATIFDIGAVGGGQLSLIPRPRGNDWLSDELDALRDAGVHVVVSLLTPEEEQDLGLVSEGALAKAAGLVFIAAPIADRGVPQDQGAFLGLVGKCQEHLKAGRHVVAHCRQSLGRAPLFAATLMVRVGVEPDVAWARISAARGVPCPEMAEQRSWVASIPP